MGRGNLFGLMDLIMRGNFLRIRQVEMGGLFTEMGIFTRVIGRMIWLMDMVLSSIIWE